jgi:signal transduction histidine kinase
MKWLASLVMIYMLAALYWWSTLLYKQNDSIYKLKTTAFSALTNQDVENAKMKWEKQNKMILGEGFVFGLSLLIGIYFIYRSHKKEILTSKTQNNFLLSFSHELKSPLTSINLSLETLKKRQLPNETQMEVCDIALKESKRLESLINSILMVAKIDDFTIVKEPIDIVKLTNEIVNIMLATGEANSKIHINSTQPSIIVNADKQAIQSVIINLVENAIKYGSNKQIEIGISKNNDHVTFKITDQGIGLSTIDKNKIFEKFYRVGDESVRSSKGTGLGLYIVKKLVDAHQGTIAVTDNLPKGCIFTLTLKNNLA